MSDSSDANVERVVRLSEEFLERYRRGERPTIDLYAADYPELADWIRDLFPSLVMIEDLAPSNPPVDEEATASSVEKMPERIGDYVIHRKIGQGGMGVVYEAQQQSLQRRVALKLVSAHAVGKSNSFERFQVEAKAAGRLHHPNIVPVFDVGQEGEVGYYTMQLIDGHGLDQVLVELRRLRGDPELASTIDESVATLAQSLSQPQALASAGQVASRTGGDCFPGADDCLAGEPSPAADRSGGAAVQLQPSVVAKAHSHDGRHESNDSTVTMARDPSESAAWSFPGESDLSGVSAHRSRYYQGVARIGIQAARALHFAHDEGIVHRDIKPSNLLLDTQANVWVTDFGLAKLQGSDLTQTGDIVGTLRYMPPERFRGWSDPRSDVYGLGMTLYELLVLRPAFECADRVELMRRVTHDVPPQPRSIETTVPRQLETIVLKAIAKEPGDRYQSASELADDLQRFLDDKPVRARRAGAMERSIRWYRRNRVVASLALLLIAALSLGFITATALWQKAERNQRLAAQNAQSARDLIFEILDLTSRHESLDVPYRAQVLEIAVGFYDSSLTEADADPELREEAARTYYQAGRLYLLKSDVVHALRAFNKQRRIAQDLVRRHPERPEYKVLAASAYASLGDTELVRGSGPRARQWYACGVEFLSRTPNPKDPSYLSIRTQLLDGQARSERLNGRFSRAINMQREVLALQQEAVDGAENRDQALANWAVAALNHAATLVDVGQLADGKDVLNAAIEQLVEVRRRHAYPELAVLLGQHYGLLSRAQLLSGDSSEACVSARLGLDAINEVATDSANERHDLQRFHACNRLAAACFDAGKVAEAVEYYQQADVMRKALGKTKGGFVARTLTQQARVHGFHADGKRAYGLLEDAIAMCRGYLAVHPRHVATRHELAVALGYLADGLKSNSNMTERAEQSIAEAIRLQSSLVGECPEIPAYACALADFHRVRGCLLRRAGQFEEAEVELHRAVETSDRLCREYPDLVQPQLVAAQCMEPLGLLATKRDDLDAATSFYRRGLERLNAVCPEPSTCNPNVACVQGVLHVRMAQLLQSQDEAAAARRQLKAAGTILQAASGNDPDHLGVKGVLAAANRMLAELGGRDVSRGIQRLKPRPR